MTMCCIFDQGSRTALFDDVMSELGALAVEKEYALDSIALDRSTTAACTGCLRCWTEQTRECVSRDALGDLSRQKKDCSVVIYLTPVIFGSMISTVKNAWDKDAHLFVSQDRLKIVMGYGDTIDDEEESTFLDTIILHRGSADVVHPGQKEAIRVFVTRSAGDARAACREIRSLV